MFKSAINSQVRYDLDKIRLEGELNPVKLGFESWNKYDEGKHLMFSRGSYVLIGGEPHHGKTKVTNELLMQLMEIHNFKIALFTPESGKVAKVFAEFYSMCIGKSFSKLRPDGKTNDFAMDDYDLDIAKAFINPRLWVFEQDRNKEKYQTIENIYKMVEETERIEDVKFDSVVIDPIYDVDDFAPKAEEVKRVLSYIDYQCEISNRVDIVVNHVAETQKHYDQKTGKRKKLRALGDEFYGGKNNQRKAKLQILVDRPVPNLEPETPEDYVPENQTDVIVLKAKPEGVAKIGTYPIFYNWKTRRFYDVVDGVKQYAQGTRLGNDMVSEPSTTIVPTASLNDAFGDFKELKTEDDDFPF